MCMRAGLPNSCVRTLQEILGTTVPRYVFRYVGCMHACMRACIYVNAYMSRAAFCVHVSETYVPP